IDVTSFVKNCHTDTCNCNLGGDCECLCTSIAAYAHKCCQQGAIIHWRSPSLCSYDCDYYNQGLGEGPYIFASYGHNGTVIGVNISSKEIFPLPRISFNGNVYFNFMLTPGLFKDKIPSPSLVSLESAERPNYFLYAHDDESVCLEQWDASSSFRRRTTFFHHQGLWIPGYSAFELYSKKGFFIILNTSSVKVSKFDDSEEFKYSSSFSIEELHTAVPYRRMCEWRYEPCTSPCVKTCSDPEGIACKFLPPVEGCVPYCPKEMILDDVTLKCVYQEDCKFIGFATSNSTSDSKTLLKTLLPTSVISPKTLPTLSEDIASLTSKHFPMVSDTVSTAPPSGVTQSPKWPLLEPKVTHLSSPSLPLPVASQKPKVTGEVTIFSKSVHIGPSTFSLPGVPQTSESFLTRTVSTESKHALPTDTSPQSTVFIRSSEFAHTKDLSSSISMLPIKESHVTPKATSDTSVHGFGPHTELKAVSILKSKDALITPAELPDALSAFTHPSRVLSVLTTRSFIPKFSASTSHSESSTMIPMIDITSATVSAKTHMQIPVASLGEHATSTSSYHEASPSASTVNADTSTTQTMSLPLLGISDIPTLSLGSRRSLTSSVTSTILSSLATTFSPQFSEPTHSVSTLWNITSVAGEVTEKLSLSPSEGSLVSSASTTALNKTAKVTELSPIHFELYTVATSTPVPTSSQLLMHEPKFTLFVPKSSTESFKTIPIKVDELIVSGWTEQGITQASEFQNATSFKEMTYALEKKETSEVQEDTKYGSTEGSSPSVFQTTLSISKSSTAEKPDSLSKVTDKTLSDWSRVPPPKSIRPSYTMTEPEQARITSLDNVTITDISHFPAEPLGTQASQTEMETVTTESSEYASFGTMIHTIVSPTATECTPRYLDPVDVCSQYVCINMGWMLYNLSRNCHKNVEKPDCGFRGMPVQINSDSCCPEWECPCQCSVLSELSIITFDGNNVALYKVASYILVKLPTESIVAHIEKCPTNQAPPGSASGLCFKKLNVTTSSYKVLINRLARKAIVDSVIQPLPFSKHGLCIQDTGAMYIINTPAGVNIKWAHVTGIIDIQYGFHSNASAKTEGLCGICNGDPVDDLKMQNRTIITNKEEIEAFIKSWEIEKSVDVTTRRLVRNCTEDNCTYCMELLHRWVFVPCHKKVSPQDFCEKMWINNTYFWNYECDALSAYVALCSKHNICIKWRTPDYCSLRCPSGKEYQPCVQPCAAKTCLNKWFYEESPCSYLREDCVCKNGTILHRTDSDLCIPEEKCACTDNEGHPRSAGEVWNGSSKGCCMYKCLENGSIIAVEPECKQEPPPKCEQEGEVIINVIEEQTCCPKKVCECNMTACDSVTPTCKTTEKLVVRYSLLSCCPQYQCDCNPSACPNTSRPECREDQFIVEAKQEDPCCFSYLCVCESCIEPIPVCNEGEILTVDLSTTHYCCPHYHCICDENLCHLPLLNCSTDMKLVKKRIFGQCCPDWNCECNCENDTVPACKVEGSSWEFNCTKYQCAKTAVGAIVLGSSLTCPPFNETECTKVGVRSTNWLELCCCQALLWDTHLSPPGSLHSDDWCHSMASSNEIVTEEEMVPLLVGVVT
ncbi:Otogelin-like protein, partial [Varanus komodoensis]